MMNMKSVIPHKMSKLVTALCIAGAMSVPAVAHASVCPPAGAATLGCTETITVGAGNSLSFSFSGQPNYDGSDDNLIGVVNNSGSTINGLNLTGSGNGGGLFNFDGDGISTYLNGGVPYGSDTTGYAGPGTSFSNISTSGNIGYGGFAWANDTGTVNFIGGLANSGSLWFSLESAAQVNGVNGGGITGSVVPEPETYAMLLAGLGLMVFVASRRKGQNGTMNFA